MNLADHLLEVVLGSAVSGGILYKVAEHIMNRKKDNSEIKATDTNTDGLLIQNFQKMSETYLMMNDTLQKAIAKEKEHTAFCERELLAANQRIDQQDLLIDTFSKKVQFLEEELKRYLNRK
jgi:hypothetical protein